MERNVRLWLLGALLASAGMGFNAHAVGDLSAPPQALMAPTASGAGGSFSMGNGVQQSTLGTDTTAAPAKAPKTSAADCTAARSDLKQNSDPAQDAKLKAAVAKQCPEVAYDKPSPATPATAKDAMFSDQTYEGSNAQKAASAGAPLLDNPYVQKVDAKTVDLGPVGSKVATNSNLMSPLGNVSSKTGLTQYMMLNQQAPLSGGIMSGVNVPASQVSLQNIDAARAQQMRNNLGLATVTLGGTGDGINHRGGYGYGSVNNNDPTLINTTTDVARSTRLDGEQMSLTMKDDKLTAGVDVPAGMRVDGHKMTSGMMEMAEYDYSRARAAGLDDAAAKELVNKVGIESWFQTNNCASTSTACGPGQYVKKTWDGVGVDENGNVMNRNNTDAQIDTLIKETQQREDKYNSSARLQNEYSSFGQYDYACHHDGDGACSSGFSSVGAGIYNSHAAQGDRLYAAVDQALGGQGFSGGSVVAGGGTNAVAGGGGVGKIVGKIATSLAGGASPGSIAGGVMNDVLKESGVTTGNPMMDNMLSGAVGQVVAGLGGGQGAGTSIGTGYNNDALLNQLQQQQATGQSVEQHADGSIKETTKTVTNKDGSKVVTTTRVKPSGVTQTCTTTVAVDKTQTTECKTTVPGGVAADTTRGAG